MESIRLSEVWANDDHGAPILKGLNLTASAGESLLIVGDGQSGVQAALDVISGRRGIMHGQVHIGQEIMNRIPNSGVRGQSVLRILQETGSSYERVLRVAALFGIGDLVTSSVHELSEDLRQRVDLARAVVSDASVVLLDDQSPVDLGLRDQFLRDWKDLHTRSTAIMAVQNGADLADDTRVAVLNNGELVQAGTAVELRESPEHVAVLATMASDQGELRYGRLWDGSLHLGEGFVLHDNPNPRSLYNVIASVPEGHGGHHFDSDLTSLAPAIKLFDASTGRAFEPQREQIVLGRSSTRRPARHVNTWLLRSGQRVHRKEVVTPRTDYVIHLEIGPLSRNSVVVNAKKHRWPDDFLPPSANGHELELVVASTEVDVPSPREEFFLPLTGTSAPVRIPITTRDRGRARVRIGVYYEKNLLQSQLMTIEVGGRDGTRSHSAAIDYSTSQGLTNLDALEPATVNICVNGSDDHLVVVNSRTQDPLPFRFTEAQVRSHLEAVRTTLDNIHCKRVGRAVPQNLYDRDNAKSPTQAISDLTRLAGSGHNLWLSIQSGAGNTPMRLLDALRDAPAKIQISRAGRSDFVFPWAMVYDIPLTGSKSDWKPCEVLEEWVAGGSFAAVDEPRCPHHAVHPRNLICPFGFWGYSHIIEDLPSLERDTIQSIPVTNTSVVVGLSEELDLGITNEHLAVVRAMLPGMELKPCKDSQDIETALKSDDLPLVYFYCHGLRHPDSGSDIPALGVGTGERIEPRDLYAWRQGPPTWPEVHWQRTSPLVFINGCHTAEITPDTLVNFVTTFMDFNAAGVVGTEISLDQRVAAEAADQVFAVFGKFEPIGEAIYRMRRYLLGKGNLMGLAYTPYCSAGLRLER